MDSEIISPTSSANTSLRNELKRPDLKGEFLCSVCHKVFCHSSSLSRHRMQAHFKNYQCMLCHQQISSSETLRSHMLVAHHLGKIFTCRCCNWAFEDKTTLHMHTSMLARGDRSSTNIRVLAKSFAEGDDVDFPRAITPASSGSTDSGYSMSSDMPSPPVAANPMMNFQIPNFDINQMAMLMATYTAFLNASASQSMSTPVASQIPLTPAVPHNPSTPTTPQVSVDVVEKENISMDFENVKKEVEEGNSLEELESSSNTEGSIKAEVVETPPTPVPKCFESKKQTDGMPKSDSIPKANILPKIKIAASMPLQPEEDDIGPPKLSPRKNPFVNDVVPKPKKSRTPKSTIIARDSTSVNSDQVISILAKTLSATSLAKLFNHCMKIAGDLKGEFLKEFQKGVDPHLFERFDKEQSGTPEPSSPHRKRKPSESVESLMNLCDEADSVLDKFVKTEVPSDLASTSSPLISTSPKKSGCSQSHGSSEPRSNKRKARKPQHNNDATLLI